LKANQHDPLPVLLGGPSGVGKSTLGEDLNKHGALFIEADMHGADAIGSFGLREAWDDFYVRVDPMPLARELEQRRLAGRKSHVVLGLPSDPLSPSHLSAARGILRIQFLFGPGDVCMRNFIKRERQPVSLHPGMEAFWHNNNDRLMAALLTADYAPHTTVAIREDGQRVPTEDLVQRLFNQSTPARCCGPDPGPT